MLTQKRLRELFDYNPNTGILTRKYNQRGKPLGSPVGKPDKHGHLRMTVPDSMRGGKKAKTTGVHRVIWIWVHGSIPAGLVIDHINHIPNDNRLINLRCVTQLINKRNNKNNIANRTGISGVQQHGKYWRVRLHILGIKNFYLGSFDTKAEAIAARRAAEIILGFHASHGSAKTAPISMV